ncbi:hypothetical protein RQP53_22205 [Paucibacter sp. APW11]|uniref:Ribosomal protein L7/L12 C-terminal domain-containing protein n=1 Tax=Roseateles aquae TaxID=3077235 RepID=A0ABU3PI14_9BURK|nr:hypothetical protein [Paucibacter sp. APW11]MDT9002007.1 hypothetical protein [Paucibacter sp. APW11]
MHESYLLVLAVIAYVAYQHINLQERLSRSEAKLDALLQHLGITEGQFIEPSAEVRALAQDPKRRIEAIKAYRRQTGLGLKDAVAMIDKLQAEAPKQP